MRALGSTGRSSINSCLARGFATPLAIRHGSVVGWGGLVTFGPSLVRTPFLGRRRKKKTETNVECGICVTIGRRNKKVVVEARSDYCILLPHLSARLLLLLLLWDVVGEGGGGGSF